MQTIVTIDSGTPEDHPALASLYDEDGYLEISAWCLGNPVRNDYGVPGSPVWYEFEDIVVEKYEVNAVSYTTAEAKEKFGKDIEAAMWEICTEFAANEGEWE